MTLPKIMSVASPDDKKKQITMSQNRQKRGSAPTRTCKKAKSAKVNNLTTKMNEAMRKTIAKNKVSS